MTKHHPDRAPFLHSQRGVSLLEALAVTAVAVVITNIAIKKSQESSRKVWVERTSAELQYAVEQSRYYYATHGEWPRDLQQIRIWRGEQNKTDPQSGHYSFIPVDHNGDGISDGITLQYPLHQDSNSGYEISQRLPFAQYQNGMLTIPIHALPRTISAPTSDSPLESGEYTAPASYQGVACSGDTGQALFVQLSKETDHLVPGSLSLSAVTPSGDKYNLLQACNDITQGCCHLLDTRDYTKLEIRAEGRRQAELLSTNPQQIQWSGEKPALQLQLSLPQQKQQLQCVQGLPRNFPNPLLLETDQPWQGIEDLEYSDCTLWLSAELRAENTLSLRAEK